MSELHSSIRINIKVSQKKKHFGHSPRNAVNKEFLVVSPWDQHDFPNVELGNYTMKNATQGSSAKIQLSEFVVLISLCSFSFFFFIFFWVFCLVSTKT